MATITEDYVGFEIAKLLKEKGFNEYVMRWYIIEDNGVIAEVSGHSYSLSKNSSFKNGEIGNPTLQMAMKWLREEYNLHIIVSPYKVGKEERAFHWCCEVYKSFNQLGCRIYANETPKSYEEGVEIAIRYCLEHLIHTAKKSK